MKHTKLITYSVLCHNRELVSYEALRPPLLYEYARRKKGSQQKTTMESNDVAQRAT